MYVQTHYRFCIWSVLTLRYILWHQFTSLWWSRCSTLGIVNSSSNKMLKNQVYKVKKYIFNFSSVRFFISYVFLEVFCLRQPVHRPRYVQDCAVRKYEEVHVFSDFILCSRMMYHFNWIWFAMPVQHLISIYKGLLKEVYHN